MSSSCQFNEEVFPLLMNEEPNPTAGSTILLSRVRSMSDVWKSLNVGTSAYALPGRLSLEIDISDRTPYFVKREGWLAGVHMARLRVDHPFPAYRVSTNQMEMEQRAFFDFQNTEIRPYGLLFHIGSSGSLDLRLSS